MNKIWAYIVFTLTITPWKIIWHFKPKKGEPVVYAPNHSSYLDIPSLCLTVPYYFIFVGKSSLEKIPLFGYMFRKLYISVNRKSRSSKYMTIKEASRHIAQKRSIVIFPEGTIPTDKNPELIKFKDGPFRIAIENQVPLVPVTIPFNWYILPDKGKKIGINQHTMKMIFHAPIPTQGMTLEDVDMLKEKTYRIIRNELKKYNPQLPEKPLFCTFEKSN